MTSTAGSDVLLATCGATARTAIPLAMMYRRPSYAEKISSVSAIVF